MRHGKEHLIKLQHQEAETTGITSLKIGFNNVFGYYLEVTIRKRQGSGIVDQKANPHQCGAVNHSELKDYEVKITGAEEKFYRWSKRFICNC